MEEQDSTIFQNKNRKCTWVLRNRLHAVYWQLKPTSNLFVVSWLLFWNGFLPVQPTLKTHWRKASLSYFTCAQWVLNTIMQVSGSTPSRLTAWCFFLPLAPVDIINSPKFNSMRPYSISFALFCCWSLHHKCQVWRASLICKETKIKIHKEKNIWDLTAM